LIRVDGPQFLRLAALYPDRRLYAPPDVELLWKTHLIRPTRYRQVCCLTVHALVDPSQGFNPHFFLLVGGAQEMEVLFGHVLDHSELTDEPTALVLAETERLWALHYGETGPYATAGQITHTNPAQHADGVAVTLPCGREAPSWEAVAAKISVEASDVEKDAQWLPALRALVAKNVRISPSPQHRC
jgi:hypothetical protein